MEYKLLLFIFVLIFISPISADRIVGVGGDDWYGNSTLINTTNNSQNVVVGNPFANYVTSNDLLVWTILTGTWEGTDGYINLTSPNGNPNRIYRNFTTISNTTAFNFSFKFRNETTLTAGGVIIKFYIEDPSYIASTWNNHNATLIEITSTTFKMVDYPSTNTLIFLNGISTVTNGNWNTIRVNFDGTDTWNVYLNETFIGTDTYALDYNSNGIQIMPELNNDNVNFDDIRYWQTIIGETKTCNDSSAGYEIYKVGFNFTFPANTNATMKTYNNVTGAWLDTLATNYNTNGYVEYELTNTTQDILVNVTLYSNVSVSPEYINVTMYNQSTGASNISPNITSYAGNLSVYKNVNESYNATANQSSNWKMLLNGSEQPWQNDTLNALYYNSTWGEGSHNITFEAHNTTDNSLYDTQTWIVTVLQNWATSNTTHYDPDNSTHNVIFDFNRTPGWIDNITYGGTNDTHTYTLWREGGYVVGTNQTATGDGVNVTWELNTSTLPNGTHWISETLSATYTISGTVTDNNGDPLTGVTVTDNETIDNNVSVTGIYNLTGYANGTYNLSYSLAGYTTDYLEVVISGADNSTADIQLDSPDTLFEYWDGTAWIEDEAQYYLWFTCFWYCAECANDEQSDSQATLKITNNGSVSGTPKMKLNESAPAGIRIFIDDDNTFADAVELTDTYQAVGPALDTGLNDTYWAWANLTGAEAWEFETYATVE